MALDAMQKLIAWGYLKGFSRVDDTGKRLLIDEVVDVIAASRSFPYPGVQLQVIKALLTAVSSNTCHVRGDSLLTAVGSIFHVQLESRSAENKTTAAGTLQQVVGIVFQRMEVWEQRKRAGLPPPPHAALLPPPEDSAEGTKATHKAAVEAAEAEAADAKAKAAAAAAEAAKVKAAAESSETAAADDKAEADAPKDADAAAASASSDADADAEASSSDAAAASSSDADAAAASSSDAAASSSDAAASSSGAATADDEFPSQYHRDAHAVFRALCSISDRGYVAEGASEATPATNVLVESKIMSLQLLSDILGSSGDAFRTCKPFLRAIKEELSDALIRNLLAPQARVVSLALRIFLQLVRHSGFRPHLSEEIEVFVEEVFLALLDSPTSSFDLRLVLLQVIEALAKDRTAFVELFANFDCVEGRQALVQRVSDTLAAIAQGRASAVFNATQRTAEQAAAVQHQALNALLSMVRTVKVTVDETVTAPKPVAPRSRDDGEVDGDWLADEEDTEEDAAGAAAAAAGKRESLAGRFEATRKEKAVLERAAIKFRMKPKAGIAFLRKIGRIDDTPESLAKCFHDLKDILDKGQIGEVMGGEKEFNIDVMHAYVDMLDFSGLPFEEGIRRFLDGFRLPGEAQKIDRMMEKFAERYLKHNPQSVFPDADCAFVLAYSVIMLNTDLHNPNILPERKMTKKGFIRNNRGVVNGQDFPNEFLERIFDAIKENPISLKEIDDMRARESAKAAAGSAKAREEAMLAERKDILQRTVRSLARRRKRVEEAATAGAAAAGAATAGAATAGAAAAAADGGGGDPAASGGEDETTTAVDGFRQWGEGAGLSDLLGPMLSTLWGPFTAAVSVLLERSDDGRVVEACLTGIRSFISAAGRLGLDTERDAVVSALSKFTRLGMAGPMTPKNVLACRALVNTAVEDGEAIGSAWPTVLHCLSLLAKLHVEAKGAREDAAFFPDHSSRPGAGHRGSAAHGIGDQYQSRLSAQQAAEAATIERRNAAMVQASIPEGRIDRVYVRSAQLSSEAVVHFISALCAVSMAELRLSASGSGIGGGAGPATAAAGSFGAGPSSPRVFSLQKVVECADYNMEVRSRVTWSRLWSALSSFFSLVGSHSNTALAMFAIDSLKQLSLKFLVKRELGAFHFQRMFLSPFSAIMEAQPRAAPEIRELILHVFMLLVRSRHMQLKSGWSTVLRVHTSAARDPAVTKTGHASPMLTLAFETIDWVVRLHSQAVASAGALEDLTYCLVAFASNPSAPHDLSVRAVDHIVHLGSMLARGMLQTGGKDDEAVATALEAAVGSPVMLGAAASDGSADGSTARHLSPEEEDKEARRLSQLAWSGQPLPEGAEFDHELLVDLAAEALLDEAAVGSNSAEEIAGAAATTASASASAGAGSAKPAKPPAAPDGVAAAVGTSAVGLARRFTDQSAHTAAWWPVLTGLMRTVADPRFPVRTRALDALFALLRRFGAAFDSKFWDLVHSGVLLPIFDDVRHASARAGGSVTGPGAGGRAQTVAEAAAGAAGAGARARKTGVSAGQDSAGAEALGGAGAAVPAGAAVSVASAGSGSSVAGGATGSVASGSVAGALDHSWLKTTCMPALTALVRLHSHSFRRLHPLLPNLLSLLEACADQEIEGLARIGVGCYFVLLNESSHRFGEHAWQLVVQSLRRLLSVTRPRAIIDCRDYLLGGPEAFSDNEEDDAEDGTGSSSSSSSSRAAVVSRFVPPPLGAPVLTKYGRASMGIAREDGTWELGMCGGTVYCPGGASIIGEIVMSSVGEQVRPLRDVASLAASASAATQAASAAAADGDAPRPLPFNSVRAVTQCVVQVELIETVAAMASRGSLQGLKLELLVQILDDLEAAAEFARAFNADRPLRRALWRSGFMRFARNNRLPSLLRQETTASTCLIGVIRALLTSAGAIKPDTDGDGSRPAASSHSEEAAAGRAEGLRRLRRLAKATVWRFTRMAQEHAAASSTVGGAAPATSADAADKKLSRETETYSPIVVGMLHLIESLVEEEFASALPWLWPMLCDLVAHGSTLSRDAVSRIMRSRIPAVLPLLASAPDEEEDDDEAEQGGDDGAAVELA